MSAFDSEEPPKNYFELTDYDKLHIQELIVGKNYTTENGFYKISRSPKGYTIIYGNCSVIIPDLFSALNYMTN